MKFIKLMGLIFGLLSSLTTQAHYLWLEQADGKTKLYFGEYEGNLREISGGRLDTIASPQAMTNPESGKSNSLEITRMDNYLNIATTKAQPVVAQELTMKVKDLTKYNIGIVKPMYYAKIGNAKADGISALDLDIQLLGDNKVRVYLYGKPLAKAKLKVYAPNQWMQELDTNEIGETAFVTPWTGLYVLNVVTVESVKGEFKGEKYDGIRHVGTLTIIK